MFEPNDGEFDGLRAQHQAQYGVSIAYIKRKVGAGTEYANEVARAVLSPVGGYFELSEMPEEFAGALGTGVSHRLISETEALDTLRRLEQLVVSVIRGEITPRALSFYVLYAGGSLRRKQEMFVLDYKRGDPLFAHGGLQAGVVPRFLKLRLDAEDDEAALTAFGLSGGIHFLLTPAHTDSGRCLLGAFTRAPGTQDLSARPPSLTMN